MLIQKLIVYPNTIPAIEAILQSQPSFRDTALFRVKIGHFQECWIQPFYDHFLKIEKEIRKTPRWRELFWDKLPAVTLVVFVTLPI